MKSINLGPHYLLKSIFGNFNSKINLLLIKMTSNFWQHCAISALPIWKKTHFSTFDFLVKMNLVLECGTHKFHKVYYVTSRLSVHGKAKSYYYLLLINNWLDGPCVMLSMAIRVVEFSNGGGTKLERFLPKNQHTQRKLLKFKNWVNGEISKRAKIWLSKSILYV